MVLGDGCLSAATSSSNARLSMGHSIKQKNYCNFKLSLVSELLRTTYNAKEHKVFNKKTNKYYPIFQGSTATHRYLTKLRKLLYSDDNTKVVNEKILKYLSLEGLAYWYMDDGGVITDNKRGKISGTYLNTQSFTYEEHLSIQNHFKEKYGIECKIYKQGEHFKVKFNVTESKKFLALIEAYKIPELEYKFSLNYEDYVSKFNNFQTSVEPKERTSDLGK
jgi:hypothetical protein